MTDIIEKTNNQNLSIEVLIGQAIEKGVSVETMERLLAMKEKWDEQQAKKAFVTALTSFQEDCPVIEKKKNVLNKDGSVRYKFAPLDSIVEQIKKPLKKYGLSYSWDVERKEGHMAVTAKVTHSLGHFETSTFEIPIDTEGYMTVPQKYASAQTFAKRYTLCNALGISTGDEDTDATDVGKERDAKSIKAQIILKLRVLGKSNKTKADVEKSVLDLTQLSLKEENYEEIASRLQMLIDESHEDKTIH